MFENAEVISSYTQEQALADGVLVDARQGDLQEVTDQHFSTEGMTVLLTAALFGLIERAVANPRTCNDLQGVAHDIFTMGRAACIAAAKRYMDHGDTAPLAFQVIITGVGRKRIHTLYVAADPCGGFVFGLQGDF